MHIAFCVCVCERVVCQPKSYMIISQNVVPTPTLVDARDALAHSCMCISCAAMLWLAVVLFMTLLYVRGWSRMEPTQACKRLKLAYDLLLWQVGTSVGTLTLMTSKNKVAVQVDCQGMSAKDFTPAIINLQQRTRDQGAPVCCQRLAYTSLWPPVWQLNIVLYHRGPDFNTANWFALYHILPYPKHVPPTTSQ